MKHICIVTAILFALSFGGVSCKKGIREEGVEFAGVNFRDPSGVGVNLGLHYKGWEVANWASEPVAVFPGEAAFSLVDKRTGATVLDTLLNVKFNDIKTYYLFQPDPAFSMQLLNNTQEEELPVRDGFIKVRLGNFAKTGLPGSKIKAVFNQLDWDTYEFVPVDTLENVTAGIPESFTEIIRRTMIAEDGSIIMDHTYSLTFLDENDQPMLDSSGMPVRVDFLAGNSVYTMYITEDASGGGDPYVYVNMVFEN